MFEFIKSLFQTTVQTGLVPDDVKYIAGLPRHEIFGSNGETFDWKSYMPPFRPQGPTMFCTAFAAASALSALEKRITGKTRIYSPIELFCRSGGWINGNTVSNTENGAKQALAKESDCPWVPNVDSWTPFILDLYKAYAKKVSPDPKLAVKGFTYVANDRDSMRRALSDSPLLAAVDVGAGYWNNPAPRVLSGSGHLVAISGIASDGRIEIFDSLRNGPNFNGFHWLSKDFIIRSCYGIVDLPENWQDLQKQAEERLKKINWRPGLTPNQKKSIESLFLGKPTAQWTLADKGNWAWATLNSPLP